MILEQFNLENQFLKYLNLVNLKKDDMHPTHLTEVRRAFYAGHRPDAVFNDRRNNRA